MAQLKNSLIAPLTGLSLLIFTSNSIASDGITGYSGINSGPVCNSCHGKNKPGIAPDVFIDGPIVVKPETKYAYKLTMTGGQKKLGALNISVDSGTLFRDGTGTTVDVATGEIKSSSPKNVMLDNTTVTWLFNWVSPATLGTSNIHASLLSANGDTLVESDKSTKLALAVDVVDPAVTTVPAIQPAKVKIVAPFRAEFGTKVQFLAVKTLDSPVGSFVKSYSWQFDDGIKKSLLKGEQVEFSYSKVGNYTVYLSTTSNNGDTGTGQSITTFFDIEIIDPASGVSLIPNAKISPPGVVVVNTEVTFSAANSTPTTINQYYWDFGGNNPPASMPISDIKHTFTTTGEHIVTLAVQDNVDNGSFTDIDVMKVNVVNKAPDGGGTVVITGLSLFQTNCESCHGIAGVGGSAKIIQGATVVLIDRTLINGVHTAIDVNSTGANNSQLIATYLGSGAVVNGTDPVADGLSLYENKCMLCHGVAADGVAGLGKPIFSAAQTVIVNAINNQTQGATPPPISLMKGITLPSTEASLVTQYLATTIPPLSAATGQTLFVSNCQMCHGTGEGGHAVDVRLASETLISNAIINIPSMNNIATLKSLQVTDKKNLVLYLAGPTYIPRPTTGPALFEMYCSYCHGADGSGAVIATKSIKDQKFSEKNIRDAYGDKGIKIMRNSKLPNRNFTTLERENMAIFLDPRVANGGN